MAAEPRRARIVDALLELENQFGQITPELVVEAAGDPASPLHKHFEWNNEIAGEQHRIDQARNLITSVKVQIEIRRRVVTAVRYVHDVRLTPREQGYVNVQQVDEAGIAEATVEAEIKRVTALIERGRNIAASLDREREFVDGVRAALR